MHAATAFSPFKRIALRILPVALAMAAVLLLPPLAVPMAFLLPLVVCPGQFSQGLWFSLPLSLVPCAGLLLAGGDLPSSLLLLPCPCLCLLLTQWASRRKLSFTAVAAMLSGLALLTQTLWWARVTALVGGDLFAGLAEQTVALLSASPNSGSLLYNLTQVGFLELPARFRENAGIPLGRFFVLNPALRIELLNALRFQLHGMLRTGIPSLLVQSSLIIGLFTALRATKELGRQAAATGAALLQEGEEPLPPERIPYPLFRAFRLPDAYRGYLLFLALASLGLAMAQGEVPALISTLAMVAFVTVYRLLGASVLVFLLCRRDPEWAFWAGLLACALYLAFPSVLFVLGMADQFMNLRTTPLFHHHEED